MSIEQPREDHHLTYYEGKGYRLRGTLLLGSKVVGKRIDVWTGSKSLEESQCARDVLMKFAKQQGLLFANRIQRRTAERKKQQDGTTAESCQCASKPH